MGNGFRLLGSLNTSLTPPWVSALTGRNCLQFTSPATSGALRGQANIFVCGATTCQLSPSSTPNAPSPLGSWTSYGPLRFLQYSPKIMHAQEVAQEVLAPQEHASGQKKLNCGLSARTFKAQEDRKLAARSRKKLRT